MKKFFMVVFCAIVSFIVIVIAGLVIASAVRTQSKMDDSMAPLERAIKDAEKIK